MVAVLFLNVGGVFGEGIGVDDVRAGGALFEAVEVREELAVDEVPEVIAGEGGVVVDLAGLVLRRRPSGPTELRSENVRVFFPSSVATDALSRSKLSRYFRKSSQDVLRDEQPL
jgi:hypothetical protein